MYWYVLVHDSNYVQRSSQWVVFTFYMYMHMHMHGCVAYVYHIFYCATTSMSWLHDYCTPPPIMKVHGSSYINSRRNPQAHNLHDLPLKPPLICHWYQYPNNCLESKTDRPGPSCNRLLVVQPKHHRTAEVLVLQAQTLKTHHPQHSSPTDSLFTTDLLPGSSPNPGVRSLSTRYYYHSAQLKAGEVSTDILYHFRCTVVCGHVPEAPWADTQSLSLDLTQSDLRDQLVPLIA